MSIGRLLARRLDVEDSDTVGSFPVDFRAGASGARVGLRIEEDPKPAPQDLTGGNPSL
jgi:hypothetical protein